MRSMTSHRRAEPRRRCERRPLASAPYVSGESGTMRQLDAAVAALRGVVSIAASADALTRLSDEVRLLSLRVERLKGADGRTSLPALDQATPMPDATPAIGGMRAPNILRPFAWSRRPHGGSEQGAAARNGR